MTDDRGSTDTRGVRGAMSRKFITVGATACAVAGTAVIGSATPAAANYPEPPEGSVGIQAYLNETAPAGCPTRAPAGTMRAGGEVHSMCLQASAAAPSREAAGAIRYAFRYLGASYSQGNRDSVNPPVFDCSSMVGRAYRSAGAMIKNYRTGETWKFYPLFGWTGAYTPDYYANTNLVRVSGAHLLPGDIIIQFDGSDPSNSAGNAGHAQMYIGNGLIIQSGGGRPSNLNVSRFGNFSFSNAWYFRFKSPNGAQPNTPPAGKSASRVIPWKYPFYFGPTGARRIMKLAVEPDSGRPLQLQYFHKASKKWRTQSTAITGSNGMARFAVPFLRGSWQWRLYAPATATAKAAVGPPVTFVGR